MPAPLPAFAAASLRGTILRMAYQGSTVHIACAFSLVEVLDRKSVV